MSYSIERVCGVLTFIAHFLLIFHYIRYSRLNLNMAHARVSSFE